MYALTGAVTHHKADADGHNADSAEEHKDDQNELGRRAERARDTGSQSYRAQGGSGFINGVQETASVAHGKHRSAEQRQPQDQQRNRNGVRDMYISM